jgi:hypothetical protein
LGLQGNHRFKIYLLSTQMYSIICRSVNNEQQHDTR